MNAVDGNTLTQTRLCRSANCTNEVRAGAPTRGPWANLCDEHHVAEVAKRRRESSATTNGHGDPGKVRSAAQLAEEGFEKKARGLVAVGRRLDIAIRKYKPAKAELDQAIEGWRSVCRALAGEEPKA